MVSFSLSLCLLCILLKYPQVLHHSYIFKSVHQVAAHCTGKMRLVLAIQAFCSHDPVNKARANHMARLTNANSLLGRNSSYDCKIWAFSLKMSVLAGGSAVGITRLSTGRWGSQLVLVINLLCGPCFLTGIMSG